MSVWLAVDSCLTLVIHTGSLPSILGTLALIATCIAPIATYIAVTSDQHSGHQRFTQRPQRLSQRSQWVYWLARVPYFQRWRPPPQYPSTPHTLGPLAQSVLPAQTVSAYAVLISASGLTHPVHPRRETEPSGIIQGLGKRVSFMIVLRLLGRHVLRLHSSMNSACFPSLTTHSLITKIPNDYTNQSQWDVRIKSSIIQLGGFECGLRIIRQFPLQIQRKRMDQATQPQ